MFKAFLKTSLTDPALVLCLQSKADGTLSYCLTHRGSDPLEHFVLNLLGDPVHFLQTVSMCLCEQARLRGTTLIPALLEVKQDHKLLLRKANKIVGWVDKPMGTMSTKKQKKLLTYWLKLQFLVNTSKKRFTLNFSLPSLFFANCQIFYTFYRLLVLY